MLFVKMKSSILLFVHCNIVLFVPKSAFPPKGFPKKRNEKPPFQEKHPESSQSLFFVTVDHDILTRVTSGPGGWNFPPRIYIKS